jgi:hypothetical protein
MSAEDLVSLLHCFGLVGVIGFGNANEKLADGRRLQRNMVGW